MKNFLFLLFVSFAVAPSALAQEPTEDEDNAGPASVLEESIEQLDAMLNTLHDLKANIIRADLGRLLVLEREVLETRDAITNLPTGHFDIHRAYQDMIRTFIYSEDWFSRDFPDAIRPDLRDLEEAVLDIRRTRGFDESPFGMVVYDILNQLYLKFEDLLKRDIDRQFKDKIAEAIKGLADAMPIAKLGDRPLAFEAADKVYDKVKSLYPYFDAAASSDALFETYITIQGLNEYYADAAQHARRGLTD